MQEKKKVQIFLILSLCMLQVSGDIVNCTSKWIDSTSCFYDVTNDYYWRDRMMDITPGSHSGLTCQEYVNDIEIDWLPTDASCEKLLVYEDAVCPGAFKCGNGRCIRNDLRCNGDDDCGDASDEYPTLKDSTFNCTNRGNFICGVEIKTTTSNTPPQSDRFFLGIPGINKLSSGYDILTGSFRGDVLSMRPFGSCRRVLKAGELDYYYRLPNNVNSFSQRTSIEDGIGRIATGAAELINATQKILREDKSFGGILSDMDANVGLSQAPEFTGYVIDSIVTSNKDTAVTTSMKVKMYDIKLKAPRYLELTNAFIQRLFDLPIENFSFERYMALINDFGTHYVSSGILGGEYAQKNIYDRCWLEDEYEFQFNRIEWIDDLVFCDRENLRNKLKPTYEVPRRCYSISSENLETNVVDSEFTVIGGSVATASNLRVALDSTTWNAWVDTIADSPSLIMDDFTLEPISSLMDIPNPMFTDDQRSKIKGHIITAIGYYLQPYDAKNLCADEAYTSDCYDVCEEDDIEVRNYTVAYLGGKGGSDYKCLCACTSRPYDECGSLRETSTIFTILLCLVVAIKENW